MAITISPDEDRSALTQIIEVNRAELARLRRIVQLHRDVLNSPADMVANLEAQAIKTAQAVEWLEEQRAKL